MLWSPEQQRALDSVASWMNNGDRPFFRLFGYAGSGKTTLAKYFGDSLDGPVYYGAFTGKAAYVMRQKGCPDATTIHKLLYMPSEKSRRHLNELQDLLHELCNQLKLDGLSDEKINTNVKVVQLEKDIELEQKRLRSPSWKLNENSPLKNATLFVVDECSMVDQRMGEDILSIGCPVLVLGDPAQLPPVMGEGFFTNGHPDILLTEIHRQARDNPILQLAHSVRQRQQLRPGKYGDSKVIMRNQVEQSEVLGYDQVIVGKNKTRKAFNARIRELKGYKTPTPLPGDRVVCLRNNHEVGLLNGGLWGVTASVPGVDDERIELALTSEDGKDEIATTAHRAYFIGAEPKFYEIKEADCFDYGYALTAHKSQGSQWDQVYIFDESGVFRQDAHRWLYTAITRAAKQVTVVL